MGASPALLLLCGAIYGQTAPTDSLARHPVSRYELKVPDVVLTGVPVSEVTLTAHAADGGIDESFEGSPRIEGLRYTVHGVETALPPFQEGVLKLETRLAAGERVYLIDDVVVIAPGTPESVRFPVNRIWGWFALLPPVVAIGLAMWLRNVLLSLFLGILAGAAVMAHGNVAVAFADTLDRFVLDQLLDRDHMLIILFTACLGSMIGVMSASGASSALVNRLARFANRRERGQIMTTALGTVVFFDDYANTLLVGSTMQPVTDRLRISREKLAFLVDSTAAPIAGLALVSTWVGFEVGQINDAFRDLNIEANGFSVFLGTWTYRFYPILLLVFVWLIAVTGKDYGPMLRAETRAVAWGQLSRPGSTVSANPDNAAEPIPGQRHLVRNAVIPLVVLVAGLAAGIWWSGRSAILEENAALARSGQAAIPVNVSQVLSHADSNWMLFGAAFAAAGVAVICSVATGSLTLNESVDAWVSGARSMFLALIILLLAWGVAAVCNLQNLNTAGFLVELTYGNLSVQWMPALAFLLAGAVSFSTGSSFSTMGLVMPLAISVTYHLLVPLNEAGNAPEHHLMLATIGGVLAGAIFGDHCSPISDTTVLSSAASGCDHLDHVKTQMPYAISVGAISLLLGYLPAGLGMHPVILLPLSLLAAYLLVQFYGKSVEQYAAKLKPMNAGNGGEERKPNHA